MATLTGFKQDRAGLYIEKDPFSLLDYTLDWTNWMPTGDTIASSEINIETISGDAAPLAKSGSATVTNNTILTQKIQAGTAGNIYNVEYRITTTNGLKDSRNFRIKVLERQA
tara:strand:- start:167 stop:502 length:336 start_codon:yes stop_codon:yes gene_type:complete